MDSAHTILASLRDVGGVVGSFVVRGDGRIAGRDMASLFGDDVLAEAGARVLRLGEALAAVPDEETASRRDGEDRGSDRGDDRDEDRGDDRGEDRGGDGERERQPCMQAATLRFRDHVLVLRRLRAGILCALAGSGVNAAALRMGMNLVARRLDVLDAQHPGVAGSGAARPTAAPQATASRATPAAARPAAGAGARRAVSIPGAPVQSPLRSHAVRYRGALVSKT